MCYAATQSLPFLARMVIYTIILRAWFADGAFYGSESLVIDILRST